MSFLNSLAIVQLHEMQWTDSVIASWEFGTLVGQANGSLVWLLLYLLIPILLLLLLGFTSWKLRQRQRTLETCANVPGDSSANSEPEATPKSSGRTTSKSRGEGSDRSGAKAHSREPDFSDFDFDEDSSEIELDGMTNRNQGFDLAAPENTEFDVHEGEQEDLLDEMYREDEQLSNSGAQADSSSYSDDTEVEEEEPKPPPKKKPQFQTHDEFSVDDHLHDDDDLDLSDDTEQDFDTCLEVDGSSASSDLFSEIGNVASEHRNSDVLDDEEERRRSGVSPEDTAVGLDVSELGLVDETLQLLESANAELEKLKRLNKDLLDDRMYLNSKLQENDEFIEELRGDLLQSREEEKRQLQIADELREKSAILKDEVSAANDRPSELQTKLLSELQTRLVESQKQCKDLQRQLNSVTSERDQIRHLLSEAEMNVPESVLAELTLLTEQLAKLRAERDKLPQNAAENGKPE